MRKTRQKKRAIISKKRVFILICLIMLTIFEVIAFRDSRANKVIEISVNIIDSASRLEDKQIILNAVNSNGKDYCLALPEYVDNKKIKEYIVEETLYEEVIENNNEDKVKETENLETTSENAATGKNIIENAINNKTTNVLEEENTIIEDEKIAEEPKAEETVQEEKKVIETKKEKSIQPNESIILTKDEIENKTITIKVVYDTQEKDDIILYNQEINAEIEENQEISTNNNIKIDGYMPIGATAKATIITRDDIQDKIDNILTDKVSLRVAYDIKIIYNEEEYEPEAFDTDVKVTIVGMEEINTRKQKYKVLHIDSENTVEEIKTVESLKDTVSFTAKEFSTYAVLLESDISTMSLSANMDSASVWEGDTATGFRFGEGTASYPYLISSGEELSYLANQVNNGNSYDGQYFSLISDINLNDKEWTPIGNYNNSFKGIFNGEGHTIANATITLPSATPTSVSSYGLFGSIGGGNSKATIKNVQIENITILITANGATSNNNNAKGYNIGIVTGTMFRNSAVKNVIVNSGSIEDTNTMTLRTNATQIFVGGIAGLATNSTSSTADPGNGNRYEIENCYSNVDVNLAIRPYSSWYGGSQYATAGQYAVGGIIGGIRNQAVWPQNCLYKGNLNATNAFTGPIFAYVRGNTNIGNANNFRTIWYGYDAGTITDTINSYFTSYSTNNRSFTTSVTSQNSNEYVSSSYMGYVQGVNKGLYTSNTNSMLNNFNNYVSRNTGENYLNWYFDDRTESYYFTPVLTAEIIKNVPEYIVQVNDGLATGNYTYKWYIDGVLDESITTNTMTKPSSWETEYNVEVLVSNGIQYTMLSFTIPLYEIHVSFEYTNGVLTGRLEGTGLQDPNFNLADYTYQWYELDISGEETLLEGKTQTSITGLENGLDYKLVATNNKYEYMTAEGTYTSTTRNVIYCDHNNGNDYNDGYTPQTPVRTLSTAYRKFSTSTTRNENVIVLMGNYSDSNSGGGWGGWGDQSSRYLDSATSTTYNRNVTITGKYGGQDYNGVLYFEASNNYRYLNGNTTFMYMTFNGEGSQTYFYLQGYSLTMGEGVVMKNYATSNTNQGLIEGNSPAFHMFAGWMQYNYSSLPRTDAKILIKSGTYGRILLGGSSGTSSASSITMRTSHNFMGTSLTNDLYKSEITIDIKNSTTPSNYTYDINLLGGGSTCGNIYGDVTVNIKNGTVGRTLGASIGDSSYRPNNWYWPINTYIGTSTINMTGGSVTEMYGGCLGRNMSAIGGGWQTSTIGCDSYFYGTVNINISGGTVTKTIYGAGAGGVSGYDANSSDEYKSYGADIDTIVNINITGGTINADIFGGGYGYTEYLTASTTQLDGGTLYGTSNINISGSPIINGNIYAAGKGYDLASNRTELAQMKGNSNITISGTPSITGSIYGAGMGLSNYADMAKLEGTSTVNINGDLSINVFGGGNIAKTQGTTNININSGNHTADIYGGGNVGIVDGETNVNINGGQSQDVYGGGKSAEVTAQTNVYMKGGTAQNVFGGGNEAGTPTTNLYLQGATITNVYGGSNKTGDVDNSNVTTTSGTAENVYGGNNQGGQTNTSHITTNGGTIVNVFGGGNQADTTTSYVTTNSGKITNVFGGANQADVTTTNVDIKGGNIEKAFGGSNQSGTVTQSNVTLENSSTSQALGGIKMEVSYTAVEAEEWRKTQNPGYVTYVTVGIKYTNNTNTTIDKWQSYIDAPGSKLLDNYSSDSKITEANGRYTINQDSRWTAGSIHSLPANGTYEIKDVHLMSSIQASEFTLTYNFEGQGNDGNSYQDTNTGFTIFGGNNKGGQTTTSNVNIESGYCFAAYGGNNEGGTNPTSNVIVNGGKAKEVYGGNNLGGTNTTSNVTVNGGTVEDVYGGGNRAVTTIPNVTIQQDAIITGSVYGGGNQAGIDTNTNVNILGGTITGNVYGGGNEGTVTGNTYMHVKDAVLEASAYAGGNGTTATVFGNANIVVEGNANIAESVFGGGNQAKTGTEENNNSNSTVNIVGGTIGKNVYGGANTSVVYGKTLTNIGYDAVNDNTLTKADILINGTVFGGGEANASGSEVYDFDFISVTVGIDMNIDGNGHDSFAIKGSIFGSGNASSTSGYSYINIKNYGTVYSPKSNISIQRTDIVTIQNSAIALSGTTDRTNEYSSVLFTLSRIGELKLKNNSTLYLDCGANLLRKFSSLVDLEDGTEEKAKVTIDETTGETTRNVDNRVYMLEGKNLNIATNEQVTTYGEVNGMTFFGLFTNAMNPSTSTGLYNPQYNNGDEITNAGTFSTNSYVKGEHKNNHDITIDGFYSNFEEDENQGYIKTKYINPTPEDDLYYIWLVGKEMDITTFEISLVGSKYATLGTYELGLSGFSIPNTKFSLIGFSSGLIEGKTLEMPNTISNIELDENVANSKFGLSMKTGNTGWLNNSNTILLTENGGNYVGNNAYYSDNSNYTPSLNFFFYHSSNITQAQKLGSVKVRFQVLIPIDDLNDRIAYIDIDISLSTALYQDNFYDAAISPGEEFELFTTTETKITDSSIFSTYYSLLIPEFSQSDYYDEYTTYKHTLVSRRESGEAYPFPKNTKITMIDMATNKYYYYVVTENDETTGKYLYNLSDFVAMGSDSDKYDEINAYTGYYKQDVDTLYENYIFHIDFGESAIESDLINNSLLMELRNNDNQTLIGVLGILREKMQYSVYKGKDSTINVVASTNKDKVYLGEKFTLSVETDFEQKVMSSSIIYDTQYFDDKMGIKMSIYDNNGNMLNSSSLLGVSFELNNVKYYPRFDGSIRINTAEKVSNVLSKIIIDTANNTVLNTGEYTIKIESFGSPDGIYYGIKSSAQTETKIKIISSTYGLNAYSNDEAKIIDAKTGRNTVDSNKIELNLDYTSNLQNPKITLSLYRRDYSSIYSQMYNLVDLSDYILVPLDMTDKENEYKVTDNPEATNTVTMYFDSNLVTGTYRFVFKLYDNDQYIGEAYEYVIIK